jgi:hypothetical protein
MDANGIMDEGTPEGFTRREFSLEAILAILSGVAITITGCGGGDYGSSPSQPPATTPPPATGGGDKTGVISANHGHSAVVTAAQLSAGGGVNLDIQGMATHSHNVSLSADQVASIAANQRVSVSSSTNDSHDHQVTFN